MEDNEIISLLTNQAFHRLNLETRWCTEGFLDMKDVAYEAELNIKNFIKEYEKLEKKNWVLTVLKKCGII